MAASDDVVVVVLDDSGSMKGVMGTDRGKMTRINAAKQALRTILGQLPESTQLGITALEWCIRQSTLARSFGTDRSKIGDRQG